MLGFIFVMLAIQNLVYYCSKGKCSCWYTGWSKSEPITFAHNFLF
jgi:hypothetical protein